MMTESLVSADVFGNHDHEQIMDNLNFFNRPDFIVFRRSLPHNDMWPPLDALYKLMTNAGYEVVTFIMWRLEKYMILSQIRHRHIGDAERAKEHINKAFKIIGEYSHGKECEVVQYEEFVTDAEYRSELFWDYGLTKPTIEYYNANEAY
jgi:hypothetical protein